MNRDWYWGLSKEGKSLKKGMLETGTGTYL